MIASYQTFPITIDTTAVSTSGSSSPLGDRLLRATADGTITFTFTDDTTLAITVKEGFDCVYSADVKSIATDTTATLLLS